MDEASAEGTNLLRRSRSPISADMYGGLLVDDPSGSQLALGHPDGSGLGRVHDNQIERASGFVVRVSGCLCVDPPSKSDHATGQARRGRHFDSLGHCYSEVSVMHGDALPEILRDRDASSRIHLGHHP